MEKRSAIFSATLELISKNGFEGTPMAKIAEHAHVGAGTIYRHFENKVTLINELYRELRNKVNDVVIGSYIEGRSAKELYKSMFGNLARYFAKNPEEFKFLEQYALSGYITQETRMENSIKIGPLIEMYQKAPKDGQIKQLPVQVLFALAYGPLVSLVRLNIMGLVELNDQLIDNTADAVWDSLKQ